MRFVCIRDVGAWELVSVDDETLLEALDAYFA